MRLRGLLLVGISVLQAAMVVSIPVTTIPAPGPPPEHPYQSARVKLSITATMATAEATSTSTSTTSTPMPMNTKGQGRALPVEPTSRTVFPIPVLLEHVSQERTRLEGKYGTPTPTDKKPNTPKRPDIAIPIETKLTVPVPILEYVNQERTRLEAKYNPPPKPSSVYI
ncbi:hypothetical protein V8F33_002866 [Rhypophila sp. PSN 637]